MQAIWNGQVLAESDQTVVVERNHYFPAESLVMEHFNVSDKTTACFWKGRAKYYSIEANGKQKADAAWYYPSPKFAARKIAGHVAFGPDVEVRA